MQSRRGNVVLSVVSILLACAVARGGTPPSISPVVLEGDSVPDVGAITTIDNVAVNNSGQWLVESDTSHADTNADGVLLRDGALLLREGQALALPVGASIGSFDAININNNGNSGWNFFLDGTTGGSDDSGMFFNADLIVQEGTESSASGFSPGTIYIGFFDAQINDSNQILSVLSVDDPAIATTVDRAIIQFDPHPMGGFIQVLVAKEGDVLPGQTESVTDFGTGPHTFAFNNDGELMFVADLTGDALADGVVYVGETIVAQEGQPSPVEGRNWMTLSTSVRMDLNNNGGYVHTGTLSGDTASDAIIVRNGEKFLQEGDTLPAIGGVFTFTSFGSGPVRITDNGDVVWFGDWNDPVTAQDTGLFINDTLLVQEGVTMIGGQLLTGLAAGVESGFYVSDNGDYIIFEGTLTGGVTGAFLITLATDTAVSIVSANPPTAAENPFAPGQPYRDVLNTGTTNVLTAGIGGVGTPSEGTISFSPISVAFSAAPSPAPSVENIGISCTPSIYDCPTVTEVTGSGAGPYLLTLSSPIPPTACTTLTFAGTATGEDLEYQSLPGDNTLNGTTNTQDLLGLILALNNGDAAANPARYNMNRIGVVNTQDLLNLVQALNGALTTQAFNGATAAACP